MVEEDGVGADHPFSGEKLAPVLALYRARDFDDAVRASSRASTPTRAPATRCGLHTRDARARARSSA